MIHCFQISFTKLALVTLLKILLANYLESNKPPKLLSNRCMLNCYLYRSFYLPNHFRVNEQLHGSTSSGFTVLNEIIYLLYNQPNYQFLHAFFFDVGGTLASLFNDKLELSTMSIFSKAI